MQRVNPNWATPVGQHVTFACRTDTPGEVDETFTRPVAAGYHGIRSPWDAEWGERYCFVADPDGNRVDVFVPLAG